MNMTVLNDLINEGRRFKENPKKDLCGNDTWVNETLLEDLLVWGRKVLSFIENSCPNNKKDAEEIRNKLIQDQQRGFLETYLCIMSILISLEEPICNNNVRDVPKDNILNQLLYGFGDFVRQLNNRYDNRKVMAISDEYDVQNLLHAQFVIFFEDVKAEDPVPINSGSSSRLDFFISDISTAIEVKKTRKGFGDKTLGDQLLDDIGRYSIRKDIKRLIFFVYDPDHRIKKPKSLKRDIEDKSNDNVVIEVIFSY